MDAILIERTERGIVMYLRILKKDLKRKITMNIILLLFIILAATFVSSSMNNLISISTAMKNYFEKAQLKDFMIITMQDKENDAVLADFLNSSKYAESWSVDENLYITDDNLKLADGSAFKLSSTAMLSSANISQQKFFDRNNKEITNIKEGRMYLPVKIMEDNGFAPGDVLTLTSQSGYHINFTIEGSCKDAFLGSTMMGIARFIISDKDYKKLKAHTKFSVGEIYSVSTSRLDQLEKAFNQQGFNIVVSAGQKLISTTYIMDMMIAGLLLVVSICLILISMVMLRFTIVFTLNEEFREIGIMKAIGIRERKIRGLYILKYLAVSVLGAGTGFFLSIPFGTMFIQKVSKNIILTNQKNYLINLAFSLLVVLLVVLFCYTCTRRVNKFSPVDAIRSGSNGERYKKKGVLRLSKSRYSAVFYMALNDILSEPRKFGVMVLIFTLGIILIIEPVNSVNTLKSNNLVTTFGMVKSDVYLSNEKVQNEFMSKDREYIKAYLAKMEQKLQANKIKARVYCEMNYRFSIAFGDQKVTQLSLQGIGTSAKEYSYLKGQAPKYDNEVAVTQFTADKIGAKLGDTVKIKTADTYKDYIITAIFQSMNNLGEGIRFTENEKLSKEYALGSFALQIRYQDEPVKKEIVKRFDLMKTLYPDFKVYTGGEYISVLTGNISGQLEGVKQIVIAVIMLINMLVAVLMEKSFLIREKGEIGMLKSIGFRNYAIIGWQVLRIGIVMLVSSIIAILLSGPVGRLSTGRIFAMMGASQIEYEIKPLEVYILYPSMVFAAAMLAAILTAVQLIRISTQETNNIE